MPQFNFHRSNNSRIIPVFRPALIVAIMLVLMLILMACGDQNTPVVSQGAAGVSSQVSTSTTGTDQGQAQGQSKTTSAPKSSKITPKPATTAKAPASTVHICSLLTKDEAAASLGETNIVIDPSRDALGEFGDASCSYTDSTGGVTVEITIAGQAKVDFENYYNNLNAQVVPGLGDAAFFLDGQVSTLKGKIGLAVLLVNPAKGPENLNSEIEVTQKVITALGKTSLASDLTDSVAAPVGGANKVPATDIPVYPGSVLVRNDSTGGFNITTYTSPDSYSEIVNWYKQVVAGKPWTGNVSSEPEAGNIVISAGNANSATASHLLIDIKGPEKADRNPGLDANGNPIVMSPNSTLISLTIY